jgi:hypothetical protein
MDPYWCEWNDAQKKSYFAWKNKHFVERALDVTTGLRTWDIWIKSSEDIPGIPRWYGSANFDKYARTAGFDARSRNWKKCQQCMFIEQSNRICGGWR